MSIRDFSNVSDDLVPGWVLQSRERSRTIAKQRREFLQRWEQEKPHWTAKAEERRRQEGSE